MKRNDFLKSLAGLPLLSLKPYCTKTTENQTEQILTEVTWMYLNTIRSNVYVIFTAKPPNEELSFLLYKMLKASHLQDQLIVFDKLGFSSIDNKINWTAGPTRFTIKVQTYDIPNIKATRNGVESTSTADFIKDPEGLKIVFV